jgi:hypothetical protein
MQQAAKAEDYSIAVGARGYAFDADLVAMFDFLEIGTSALRDRMEKLG